MLAKRALHAAKCTMILAGRINCAVSGSTELQLEYFALAELLILVSCE